MIKIRFIVGSFMVLISIISVFVFYFYSNLNSFIAGAFVVTLLTLGLFYIFFSFESKDYLEDLEKGQKTKKKVIK